MVAEHYYFFHHKPPPSSTLGILAFHAANTMRRLIALYNSLTDAEILALRTHTLTSKGIAYLNSKQECFLLNLACAERLEDLDHTAATVSRLSQKCANPGFNRFDLVYADLKRGVIGDAAAGKLEFNSRRVLKSVEKMEKLVLATGDLHVAMECLSDMEASKKKLSKICKVSMEDFCDQIAFQRKRVSHYKNVSLWNQTFDKTVTLMGRVICVVYTRICSVFGPYISGYCPSSFENDSYCLLEHRELYESNHRLTNRVSKSGPIPRAKKSGVIRFASEEIARNNRVSRMASGSTVGGSGLSTRYASVVLLAERFLHAPETVGERERGELPVARDTVRWQEERSMERQRYDTRPTTLLVQTLHYSDLDKAEAAIVEVLVGLSCVYRYEKRRR
ncbi:Avr9/Cf-9 rapidly elicited protein [Senna tora]|uniref:Avr9/Cf-9 rapidly elicited protein n=1 Tax=Senna tora TaxID=362788 RepID=A0A834WJU6_9FABA|nr:Avr9/Cf-9 rapidly elicited protein [Senna tora]